MSQALRIGLLLDSPTLYAWEAAMLNRVVGSNAAEIVLIVTPPADAIQARRADLALSVSPRSESILGTVLDTMLMKVYRALEAKIQCKHDAFALREGGIVPSVPVIRIPSPPAGGPHDIEQLKELRKHDIDVFIQLGTPQLSQVIAPASKYGIWSLRHAHLAVGDIAGAGFWPVYGNWSGVESRVEVLDRAGNSSVLARSFTGTNRFSVKLSSSALHWKTASLIPRQLERLHRSHAVTAVSKKADAGERIADSGKLELDMPTRRHIAQYIAQNVRRRAGDWLSRNFIPDRWILLFHVGEDPCTSGAKHTKIIPPADRYWADPWVIRRGDGYYVFVEEYLYSHRKGHISVLRIHADGTYTTPVKVLERAFHLSYPCIFEFADEIYMIPESSDQQTVDVYRCVEFPLQWEFVKTLLPAISAVDPTIIQHAGKWWLFVNVVENPGASYSEELFLFYSDNPIEGEWTPHACNPIVSDVRRSRPAGGVFRHNGRLYRPAQDCSRRYGYSVVMHEIVVLSEEEYVESVVGAVEPTWDPKIIAVHTFSYTPGITVMDGLQPRPKL